MTDFEEWYAKYYKDVYKFTLSLCRSEAEAEELTQNAFFKALNSIESFKGECSVYAWLCQIAKNAYFTQCRRKKYFAPQEPPETAGGTEPEQTVLTAEAAMELHRALHGMEEPYKEVLMLRIFGELPFARIAELFGKTETGRASHITGQIKVKGEIDMKISCEVIGDLLPLYHDHVCSEDSTAIVEEHLKSCQNCRDALAEMDETFLAEESFAEIEPARQAARALKKSKMAAFFKGGLLIAMIACVCCFVAYNLIGSYVAPDGTLVEPFYLIPLAWLFFLFGLLNALGLLAATIVGAVKKHQH